MSKVSVLMAAYNSEKYIAKTIESLLMQTHKDLQIICIDDVSTDSTYSIIKEYAAQDSRIKVLQMERNSGQAKARNQGLAVAEGDYITVLDSDDWLSEDAIERAVEVLNNNKETDTVLFKLTYFNNEDNTENTYPMRSDKDEWSGEEAFRLSLDWSIHGLYMCRSELYRDYPFDDSCRLYSDDNTTRIHYLHSGNIKSCNGIYYYRQHQEEMTHKISIRRFDLLEANISMKNTLIKEKQNGNIIALFECERWKNFVGTYGLYRDYHKQLNKSDERTIKYIIRNCYSTIEPALLPKKLGRKFGYIYFRLFGLFKIEAAIYFTLRKLFAKG